MTLLALINSAAEVLGILVVEKEGKVGNVLDSRSFTDLHLVLSHGVVVVKNLDGAPHVLTMLVAG